MTSKMNYHKILIMIGVDSMIELEENKRKLVELGKKIVSIGESL